jgi:peptidoglycan hydrolase-like protein with peptidoglycan-binding domain
MSYWRNHYDVKLAEQYQRFASGSLPNLEMRTAQVALLFLGYAPGKIDGCTGPRTRAAIKNFRIAAGMPAGEELDGPTYQTYAERPAFDRRPISQRRVTR